MSEKTKTPDHLIRELEDARRRIAELEAGATERKPVEEVLKESEKRYRLLVGTVPHGIQEIDTSGVITFCNQAYTEMLGYSEGELVGKYIWELLESDSEAKSLPEYLANLVKDQPPPTPYLTKNRKKNGGIIDAQVDWTYKRDESGHLTGFISVITEITERIQAEDELKKHRDHMEEQVEVRTAELSKTIEKLESEITERKRAEEALQESEERFRRLSEASFETIVITEHGKILAVNNQCSKMFGYEPHEVIDMEVVNFIAPESRELVKQRNLGGYEDPYEHKALRKDGSTFDVLVQGKAIPYNGRTVRVTAICDISERKRGEEALLESHNLLKAVIEGTPNPVLLKDLQGRYLMINAAGARHIRMPAEEIIGKNDKELFSPEIASKLMEEDQKVITSGETQVVEEIVPLGSEELIYLSTKSPFRDKEGKIIGVIVLARDITERKRAEEAVRESEARLAEAQRIANLGSWDWNLETNKFCCSEEAYRVLGMGPRESCPSFEEFLDFVHPDDREFVRKAVDESIHERKPFSIDHRTALPEGSERVVHQEGEVFRGESGRPIRMAGTILDITERKRAEDELEKAHEQVKEQARRLTTLAETSRKISAQLDIEELFRWIVQEAEELLKADGVGLRIREGDDLVAVARSQAGDFPSMPKERLKVGEGLSGWVAQTGRHLVVGDVRAPRQPGKPHRPNITSFRSYLGVPVKTGDQVLGTLNVYSVEKRDFTPLEVNLATTFADQVAIALTNARLFDRVKEKRDYLGTLIEQSTDAIIATDRDGKITLFNEGAEALSGYRRDEVVGRRGPVLYERDEDAREVMHLMREGGGTVSGFETTFRAKDGAIIPVLISASLLYDDEGREVGTVGFSKDLRERKRKEDEVRSLKEFNENVVQSIQDGLATLDRDFRITFWNKAMEEISGYAAEEVLGQVAYDVFPHLIEQGVDDMHKTALEGRVVSRSNVPYLTPKGKAGYSNEKYSPLRDEAGKLTGVLIIVEDVTETLRLEERVIQLQQEIEQRKLVEIAKGVLMREVGLSEAESYKFIQKKSRDENRKMGEVAKQVIDLHGISEERKKFT